MIEIEFSALARGCLHQRIPTLKEWERQVLALVTERHEQRTKIDWQFSTEEARQKLSRHYEQIKSNTPSPWCRKT